LDHQQKLSYMPNWLRALIAGYGAKKLGGGCFSTILIFVIIYYALGQCNHPAVHHAGLRTTSAQTAKLVAVPPAATSPRPLVAIPHRRSMNHQPSTMND
jgi:accessory gene regulator protein AgrB